jgi:acyl transferase domain-containing protein/NADPH:quinone reductase-like Zn-dependent oxidoreductase/acyl carrier protein/NADP-dependent 3-hydroxy acid dehydrogenase YdfG
MKPMAAPGNRRGLRDEDIAVIGMACRFPGAPGPEAYWRLLRDGIEAVTTVPPGRQGAGPSGRGGFLDAVDEFDPGFFGISGHEADQMDPQQRLVLELGWECLEDAGIAPGVLRGSRTGVYVGVMAGDHALAVCRPGELAGAHALAGSLRGMVANRLSYLLAVTGPSLVVDTGQSSSLTAVHLACDSLRAGVAGLAIAGGVSLILSEESGQATSAMGVLSPEGRCFTFDARANGYVRGEGAGLVLLKPLAAALADGDRVHAVIRGSAVNHDGGVGALTVPNPAAQREVLRLACLAAGVEPADVQYVELHGTGTRVGDPVEAAALGAVMGEGRPAAAPLRVGSAKTNIGHLEGAAGIAGLLKAVLAVRYGELPPSLNFTTANPGIPLERLGLMVQVEREQWALAGPRLAGVSSFGLGGANCHVIVAEAPAPAEPGERSVRIGALAFVVSGRTPQALRAQAATLRAHLTAHPELRLEDVAYSLFHTRTAFEHRAVVIAADWAEILRGLDTVAAGHAADELVNVVPEDRIRQALTTSARAFLRGEETDWPGMRGAGRRVDLPRYAFQRRPCPAGGRVSASPPLAPALAGDAGSALGATPRGAGLRQELRARLAPLSESERKAALLKLVRERLAVLPDYPTAEAVGPDLTFADLGLDSMTAVAVCAELESMTGLRIPVGAVFDHPTPRALAGFLARLAFDDSRRPAPAVTAAGLSDEPVAIVGMGCRYPGGVRSPEALWDVVAGERDVFGEFPTDRGWDLAALFGSAGSGTSYLREGGFLYDAAEFDAGFFGISPREALAMDPQQRLLLEVSWEAVERAGIDPLSLNGTATGVFAGVIPQQYDSYAQQAADDLDGYIYTGSAPSVLAGRVAYSLGLQGPAFAVDSACSSSLVALHLACQSLRQGECALALAGGVTVMATPLMFVEFSRLGALAQDGRCKAFAAAADGTGWAEGAGMLVLERLSDARRNGHRVFATVRGSAINEDGASNGLTAPNGTAQQRVIGQALENARLAGRDVDVVEAHGPGTALGDPIEASALLATYGADRKPGRPVYLGSVKSNIGHTQAAAGVAGVIKMVMAMQHKTLPRTLHVDEPTRHVDWSSGTLRVLTVARSWPDDDGKPRRAGVSSFGAGGTNAHVILESAPPVAEPLPSGAERPDGGLAPLVAWPLSARTRTALTDQADQLHVYLTAHQEIGAADAGLTLARRSSFEHRAVVLGREPGELIAALRAVADQPMDPPVATAGEAGPVFAFPGQGSQWAGMAAGLLGSDAVFDASVCACAEAFGRYTDWSLTDILRGDPVGPPLDRVDITQPALFTMMVSLAAMWRARGVEPAAVVGHSQGEVAAAYVAGALSLDDAARIIALRSRALLGLAGQGAMAAVSLSADDLRGRLRAVGSRLEVAAVNSPASATVGGEPAALEEFLATLSAEKVRFRRLPGVTNAGHSAQIEPLREHLLEVLARVTPQPSAIPFYSTVTGERLDTLGLDGAYWWRNAREPVLFEMASRALLNAGHQIFIEVSPHPLLHAALAETITSAEVEAVVLGTLRREEEPGRRFLAALGEAYRHGCPVNWTAGNPGTRIVPLPTYAFQHQRYWPAPAWRPSSSGGSRHEAHPLLNATVELPDIDGLLLIGALSTYTHPWLADHALLGTTLVPGTAVVELAWTAAQRAGSGPVEELVLETPLVLPEDGRALEVQVMVKAPGDDGARSLAVYARPGDDQEGSWTRHAHGTLAAGQPEVVGTAERAGWPPERAQPVDLNGAYERLARHGYEYGPAFQGLRRMWRMGEEIFAEVTLPEALAGEAGRFSVHPALLDAALHAILLTAPDETSPEMPFSWSGLQLHQNGSTALCVRIAPDGADGYSLEAISPGGRSVASVATLAFRRVPGTARPAGPGARLLRLEWIPAAVDRRQDPGAITVLGAPHPALRDVAARTSLSDLLTALDDGIPAPGTLVVRHAAQGDLEDPPQAIRAIAGEHLDILRTCLTDSRLAATHLVLLTAHATNGRPDLPAAALAGLWRSAATEHPHRITLIDTDDSAASQNALAAAVTTGHPQLALHDGIPRTPTLQPARPRPGLTPPTGHTAWRLGVTGAADTATLDELKVIPAPEYDQALTAGQVRVAVRAAGLNFVDVLTSMGMGPRTAGLGREFAGIVSAVAPDVTGLVPGDRVMGIVGLTASSVAPVVVTDRRLVVPVPAGWSFAEAAGTPIAFLTAYYGLVVRADLSESESVLVHAATGGVGMAAVQLARHLGAEVYATAHPRKWPVLNAMGVTPDRIASSRTLDFETRFAEFTSGRGVDVVLNSLAGEFVDASLRLLPRGGRFLEMGKLDIRTEVALPGVSYDAFDIYDAGPDLMASMLADLLTLFGTGALRPLPVTAWDVGDAREALRHFRDARHTGKLVVTFRRSLDQDGTVLITGGTGTLGGMLARHLVTRHGARHLHLAGLQGPDAPGAGRLGDELAALGATVTVTAHDVADAGQVAALLAAIPADRPLTGIVHAAGALDDAAVTTLTPEQLDAVLRPKVDAAWQLHQQTRHLDLSLFVLYSSIAGTLGLPGQANYAAANAFLDALARYRTGQGLPAHSIAWGLWAERSRMSSHLGDRDFARMAQGGIAPLATADGLALFDAAIERPEAALVAARVDTTAAPLEQLPPLLRGLVRGPAARRREKPPRTGTTWRDRLAGLPAGERNQALLTWVCEQSSAVLRLPGIEDPLSGRVFRDLGYDSLTAIELRNRLNAATSLRLPVTVVFDHPSAQALAAFIHDQLFADEPAPPSPALAQIDRLTDILEHADGDLNEVAARLESLLTGLRATAPASGAAAGGAVKTVAPDIQSASADELLHLIDQEFGLGPPFRADGDHRAADQ